jgi:hypothetical protein
MEARTKAVMVVSWTTPSPGQNSIRACTAHTLIHSCFLSFCLSSTSRIETNGLCKEEDYPYTSGGGQTGTCKKTCKKAVTLAGHSDVFSESGMIPALNKGPVSVGIEADKSAFQLYKGGVLDNPVLAPLFVVSCTG